MRRSRIMAALLAASVVFLLAPVTGEAQARMTSGRTPEARDEADGLTARERAAFEAREAARLRRRGAVDGPVLPGTGQRPPLFPTDGGFGVLVDTDAPEYAVFADGTAESIFLRVVSEQDGFLTLLSGGTGPGYTVLAPGDLIAQLPIRAGEPLQFPLPAFIFQGIELKPQLPDGVSQQQQSIIAIVTRRQVPLPLFDPLDPRPDAGAPVLSVRLFQNWLARIPVTDRGVGQALYLVARQ